MAPLLKPVIAVAGDEVTVAPAGVSVNGRRLAGSALRTRDARGRVLTSEAIGTHRVKPGEMWVLSTFHPLSFDSRYLGPVALSAVQGVAEPVWVQAPEPTP